jgi:hypothetical protein
LSAAVQFTVQEASFHQQQRAAGAVQMLLQAVEPHLGLTSFNKPGLGWVAVASAVFTSNIASSAHLAPRPLT